VLNNALASGITTRPAWKSVVRRHPANCAARCARLRAPVRRSDRWPISFAALVAMRARDTGGTRRFKPTVRELPQNLMARLATPRAEGGGGVDVRGGRSQCHSSTGIGGTSRRRSARRFARERTIRHPRRTTPRSPVSTTTHCETSPAAARHAECPTATTRTRPTPPLRRGQGIREDRGVWGIEQQQHCTAAERNARVGERVRNLLQVSWRLANKPQINGSPAGPYPNRQVVQFNMRLMFNPRTRPTIPFRRPGSARLTQPVQRVDGFERDLLHRLPRQRPGPEGADARHRAVGAARVELQAPARGAVRHGEWQLSESAAAYALCYKCHDRSVILTEVSFRATTSTSGARVRRARSVTIPTASAAPRATRRTTRP